MPLWRLTISASALPYSMFSFLVSSVFENTNTIENITKINITEKTLM